ncbi:MAG TPA: hypothetical protein VOA41_14475 [Candidatus Dormibacteraeota bacterium]|nr:hypothetical protein [Candidatus Dormibacteraeota bacterium]
MKRYNFVIMSALAFVLAVSAFAREKQEKEENGKPKEKAEKGEKHLKKSDLPAAVQKTADEQSQGATVKGYATEMEKGKRVYEVELTVNGHDKDVTIAADGTILEVEEQAAVDSLPSSVRDGLQKKAGAGNITKVETITKNGKLVAYEAVVKNGKKTKEIQVGPDGQPLAKKE